MSTKVRNYTTAQLLAQVKKAGNYNGIPENWWILGVRSNEDTYNTYDDKFYIFRGKVCYYVLSGSTNAGAYGIQNFAKWNSKGVAHIKSNEWYLSVWKRGLHNGRMPALRQVGAFKVYRDGNKTRKLGDVPKDSWTTEYHKGLNFHANNYNLKSKVVNWIVGGWSTGCQVVNNIPGYVKFLNDSKPQEYFTYCLIDEFEV